MTRVLRLSRSQIENAIAGGAVPEHLVPLKNAVLRGVRLILVKQSPEPFAITHGKPYIVLIGDDLTGARGPAAFHKRSLVRAHRRANGVVIVSSAALPEVYALAAQMATCIGAIPRARARKLNCTLIIESAIVREPAWVELAKKYAPDVPLLLSTVKGGTA
jgi:voltage-gated potassium channel Kch